MERFVDWHIQVKAVRSALRDMVRPLPEDPGMVRHEMFMLWFVSHMYAYTKEHISRLWVIFKNYYPRFFL